MKTRGVAEYDELSLALQDYTPPCSDDSRFILEPHEISPDELTHLSITICRPCPLKHLCRAYAEKERPAAGIWAGRTYPSRKNHAADASESRN